MIALLLLTLLVAPASTPGTVTVAWDANTDGVTVGYRLFYGLTAGSETEGVVDTGIATTVAVTGLVAGTRVLFHVRAYDAAGQVGPSSSEIAYLVPQVVADPCAFPLGASSVSIFVTGKLQKTGSGGPGSRAFVTFQVASPNSPVTVLSIRANGVDVPDSVTLGTNLRAPGSLWFTIPLGSFTYSVFAQNAAGCTREQATGFTTGP